MTGDPREGGLIKVIPAMTANVAHGPAHGREDNYLGSVDKTS